MAGCLITSGVTFDCDDRKRSAGGVRSTVYVGNIGQLDQTVGDRGFTFDSEGYVTSINFSTYGGLYAFEGVKGGNDANDDAQRTEGAANVNFPVNLLFKIYDSDPAGREAVENLAFADALFAIIERTGGQFELMGRIEGLTLESAPSTRGTSPATDTGRICTLTGSEPELPKFVLDTDYATTKALIESYLL